MTKPGKTPVLPFLFRVRNDHKRIASRSDRDSVLIDNETLFLEGTSAFTFHGHQGDHENLGGAVEFLRLEIYGRELNCEGWASEFHLGFIEAFYSPKADPSHLSFLAGTNDDLDHVVQCFEDFIKVEGGSYPDGILILDKIFIEPRFRGQDLGLKATQLFFKRFIERRVHPLALTLPYPIAVPGQPSYRESVGNKGFIARGQRRLQAYWRRIGFKRLNPKSSTYWLQLL